MRYLSIITFLLLVVSCQFSSFDREIPVSKLEVQTKDPQYYVDRDLALFFASNQGEKGGFGILNYKPIVRDGDTLCYVVNYKKGGWDIISSDKRSGPVIMSSDEGEFPSFDEMPDGMRIVLDLQLSDLQAIKKITPNPNSKSVLFWNKLSSFSKRRYLDSYNRTRTIDVNQTEYNGDSIWCKHNFLEGGYEYRDEVSHLITTKWGQTSPWNDTYPIVLTYPYTTRAFTGCVAVAIGQILYFCHNKIGKPTGLYHDVSFYGVDPTTNYGLISRSSFTNPSSRWDNMSLTAVDDTTSFVSDLLADIGYRVNMRYLTNGSFANLYPSYLSSFGISCSKSDYNSSTVIGSLLNGMPVIVEAYPTQGGSLGHAFIIDGCRRRVEIFHNWYYFERVPYDDDLWEEYNASDDDYISDENFAIEYPDAVPGVLYDEYWEDPIYYQLTLNWGYDGNQDNVWVYLYPSSWQYNNIAYQYRVKIVYGFN